MPEPKRPALGKGLSALIPDASEAPRSGPTEVDIDLLTPNPYQPRVDIDEERLEDLTRSIKTHGVIQPILVRQTDDGYHIIAGERRWRAAQRAGLLRVPVVVKDLPPGTEGRVLEMALIENIQRENLNPIEEGLAYRRLAEEFHLTQDAIAAAVGKDRSTVANMLRLLRLPSEIQNDVSAGRLSMGHARALLAVESEVAQRQLGREVVARGLSVRETESLVRKAIEHAAPSETPPVEKPDLADVHTRAAEDQLKLLLGTRVRIVRRSKGGRIEIAFKNEEELIRIYELLTER